MPGHTDNRDNSSMAWTYTAVLVLEAFIIVLLWILGRQFSA